MRKIELNFIEIDGEQFPIYCDLFVLEKIQEEGLSISQFERDIIGAEEIKDDAGEPVRDEEGRIKLRFAGYKVHSMLHGLYLMIEEGVTIFNEQGGEMECPTEAAIARAWRGSLGELSDIIHREFNLCFEVKKNTKGTQSRKKKM